jgi:hypothetical protein
MFYIPTSGKERRMRRVILLLTTMAVTLVVASSVAWAVTRIGTDGPDTFRGTNGDDNLMGLGGNDVLFALGGKDNLLAGEGKDWTLGGDERRPFGDDKTLVGGPGNDGVQGGLGSDTLLGGSGDDFVHGDNGGDRAVGGEGRDFVDGAHGPDQMVGGEGGDFLIDDDFDDASRDDVLSGADDDIILADHVPAFKDVVSCGGGFDQVMADKKDVVADDCEKVRVIHGTEAEAAEQEQAFFESLPPAELEFGVPSSTGWHQTRLLAERASLPRPKGTRVRRVESYKTSALLSSLFTGVRRIDFLRSCGRHIDIRRTGVRGVGTPARER